MQTVIIVVHLMIVLAMVGLVLLQRSEGGGLGMGGGAGFMSTRGTTNVLTRATAILAGLFFLTSLVLSILAGYDRGPRSVLTPATGPSIPQGPISAPPANTPPANTPPAPSNQPAGEAPPAGPQVPRQ